jgi:hypothetical protein
LGYAIACVKDDDSTIDFGLEGYDHFACLSEGHLTLMRNNESARVGETNDWIWGGRVSSARKRALFFEPPGNELVVCPTTAVAPSSKSEQQTAARRTAAFFLTSNMTFLL